MESETAQRGLFVAGRDFEEGTVHDLDPSPSAKEQTQSLNKTRKYRNENRLRKAKRAKWSR
jgi:hypothetical protein